MPSEELRQDQPQTAASPLGPDDAEHVTPDSTAGNTPAEAKPSSVAVNTVTATEAQKLQADTEINQDPEIRESGAAQPRTADDASQQDYNDMNLEELREELSRRHLSKSGNKPDLIKRLEEHDASQGAAQGGVDLAGGSDQNLGAETTDAELPDPAPTDEVEAGQVDNGGILRTDTGQKHAEILQGLSAERRQQQLEVLQGSQQEQQADEAEQPQQQQA